MGSQTISEEKEKKFMSKKIQYWNGSEWEEKDESCSRELISRIF